MPSDFLAAAAAIRERAYAPYSGYLVGSAIEDEQGRIHVGANVENLSYGGAICAERSAAVRMIAEGGREIRQIAVVTADGGPPCGICRQFLVEFAPNPSEVHVQIARADDLDHPTVMTLADLLPMVFRSNAVHRTAPDQ